MAFNLFDFSTSVWAWNFTPQASPTMGGATGGGMMPPTISSKPLPQTPMVKKPIQATPAPTFMEKAVNMIVPKASASNEVSDKDIQDLIDAWYSDEEIAKVIESYKPQEQQTQEVSPTDYPTDLEPEPSAESVKSSSPSLLDKIGQSAEKRGTTYLDLASSDSNFLTKGLWAVWEGVSFLGDVIGDVAMSSVSEVASNPLNPIYWGMKAGKAAAKKAWNSLPDLTKEGIKIAAETGGDVASAIGEGWKQVEQVAPETARNIKSIAQIVTALPWAKPSKEVILWTAWVASDVIDLAKQIPEIKPNVIKKAQDYYSKSEVEQFNKPSSLPDPQYKKAREVWDNAKRKWTDLWQVARNNNIQYDTLNDGGKFNAIDTAKNVREDAIKASNDMIIEGIREADKFTEPTSANKIRNELLKQVENDKNLTGAQRSAMTKYIDNEFDSIIKDYGEELSLESMQKGKVKFDRNSKYDEVGLPSDSNIYKANKAIADKLRASIEKGAWANLPIREVNASLAKQFELANYLEELHGKKVPQTMLHNLTRVGAKALWGTTGAVVWGWAIWAFAWYQSVAVLFDTLSNLPSPLRSKMLNSIKSENPEAYKQIQEFIIKQKYGAKKTFPLLPAWTKESIRNVRGEVIDNTLQESTASKVAKSKEELSGKIVRQRSPTIIVNEAMKGKTIQTKKMPTTIKREPIKKSKKEPPAPKAPIRKQIAPKK